MPDAADSYARCFSTDTGGTILASIYSLPSRYFSAAEAEQFLAAVRRSVPRRDVIVLSDLPLAPAPGLHLLRTGERDDFTPWPRDPFSLVHDASGSVRAVVRPNLQPGREDDGRMARVLLRLLPPTLRQRWHDPTWSAARVPFHNGQLLVDRDALWLSIHSVEPRTLELLGFARVPVESFSAADGPARYAAAVRRAAAELGELFGRPARFIHSLPDGGTNDRLLMEKLGGGAGFDLDSLVTLLRPSAGVPAALVADPSLAEELLPPPDDSGWDEFRRLYGLAVAASELRTRLGSFQSGSRSDRLDRFLDLVAEHLAGQGFAVGRLPVMLVPVPWLARPELVHPDFLLGWNNVVLERAEDGSLRAEGFASGLAPLDLAARRCFAAAGATLSLLPPLVESVVRNGGYRCASNHLRVADCAGSSPTDGTASRNR